MNRDTPWDLYRTFLAVLEEASLSGAARRLGLTQPTVSRHVDALEEAVGAALFVRSHRGLSPTEVAEALAPYARSLAATAEALARAAADHGGEARGTVRISAAEVVGLRVLPPILAALRRDHPALEIELVLSDAIDDLLERQADVAVRMVEPQQDALVARRVGTARLGFHARSDYLDRRGTPTSIADLTGHDLVGFDRETPGIRAMLARLPALDIRPAFAFRCDSNAAQLAAIEAGLGIGICQSRLAASNPALVPVLADTVRMDLPVHVVMHQDLRSSPRCRAAFDALAAGCGRFFGPS